MPAYIVESTSRTKHIGRGNAPQNNGRKQSPRELRMADGEGEDYREILGRLTRGNGRPFVWAFPGK